MILKSIITIPELSGSMKRRLYVSLPADYEESTASYPVLYMFDGHNVFYDEDATYGKSWGMKKYIEEKDSKLIIVAVECNYEGNNRLSEYTPFDYPADSFFGEIRAKGKIYMDWTVNTLKPMIDQTYRTLPDRDHTMIAGSSMGGLMTLYAMTAYADYFTAGAAISPAVSLHEEKIHHLIEEADFSKKAMLYIDIGENERGYDRRNTFLSIADHFEHKGVPTCLRIIPGGYHNEASWEKQVPFWMKWLAR